MPKLGNQLTSTQEIYRALRRMDNRVERPWRIIPKDDPLLKPVLDRIEDCAQSMGNHPMNDASE